MSDGTFISIIIVLGIVIAFFIFVMFLYSSYKKDYEYRTKLIKRNAKFWNRPENQPWKITTIERKYHE